jgi:hypothetical protein
MTRPKGAECRALHAQAAETHLDREKKWWWTQSSANPSQAEFPVKQGKCKEFIRPNRDRCRLDPVRIWFSIATNSFEEFLTRWERFLRDLTDF